MRIAGNCIHREPYQLQELLDPLAALFLGHQVVDTQRLADELAYGVARVQGGDRVLEDDLHVAAQFGQLTTVEGPEISALEHDAARCRPLQEEYVPTRRRLAAAALADQAEGLVGLQGEADPVDGMYRFVAADHRPRPPDVVVDDQFVDLEQRRGGRAHALSPSVLQGAIKRPPPRPRKGASRQSRGPGRFPSSAVSRYGNDRWPARTGAQTGILR